MNNLIKRIRRMFKRFLQKRCTSLAWLFQQIEAVRIDRTGLVLRPCGKETCRPLWRNRFGR
ncbi:MAG: hypothetical protein FWH36_07765 [Lentimicrobiaceae bacterium]|nr:hypothetical protein [Lentimicrobiaceae bacterium]